MMEQKVKQRPIVVFNGDVTEKELSIIPEDFDGDIVIHGNLKPNVWQLDISGSVWVMKDVGDLETEIPIHFWSNNISVRGDFYCEGDIGGIGSSEIAVGGNFCCKGNINIDSGKIEVGGDFDCEGDINSNPYSIKVGGDFDCKGDIKSGYIGVEGQFHCKGSIDSYDIKVKGNLECEESIDSFNITIAGDCYFKGEVNTNGCKLIVSGEKK